MTIPSVIPSCDLSASALAARPLPVAAQDAERDRLCRCLRTRGTRRQSAQAVAARLEPTLRPAAAEAELIRALVTGDPQRTGQRRVEPACPPRVTVPASGGPAPTVLETA